ncbi:MAG: helix-turn-helix transcriptional regulator [Bacillota bacterium]
MNSKSNSFIGMFKWKSIFTKIFMVLIFLSIIMMLFFGYFTNYITLKTHQEKINSSNLSLLKQVSDTADITFFLLSQNMTQSMWDDDLIQYMINPQEYCQDRDYRIIRLLNSSVLNIPLVKEAYFYSPIADMVFSSDGTIKEKSVFEDASILNEHLNNGKGRRTQLSKDTFSEVFYEEGRLFIAQDLIISAHIGTLIYEIDQGEFYDTIGAKNSADETIYIFQKDNRMLFESILSRQSSKLIKFQNQNQFLTNAAHSIDKQKKYYLYTSEVSGWKYIKAMDYNRLKITTKDILPLILPAFLLFFFFSILFSLYITKEIYKPINRLMNFITGSRKIDLSSKKARNEIDYIELAYSDAIYKNDHLAGIMCNLAQDVMEQLLRNLLMGKQFTDEHMGETLEGIGNPVAIDNRYVVLAAKIKAGKDVFVKSVEANLYFLSVSGIIESLQEDNCKIYCIHMEKDIIGIVLSFLKEDGAINIKRKISQVKHSIIQNMQNSSYQVLIGIGKIYNHLNDIQYSYYEALEVINDMLCPKYQSSDIISKASSEGLENMEFTRNRKNYYLTRVKHIIQASTEGDQKKAELLLERVLSEIANAGDDINTVKKCYETVLDELMDKLLSFRMDMKETDELKSKPDIIEAKDIEQMRKIAWDFGHEAIYLIGNYSSKNRYRYIEEAKRYISNNYANSNLSLNEISEYIGINPSYFSDLFREITNESFSSYLNSIRVKKAKDFLKMTKLTIQDIGYKCGFNSAQNFNRVFKKYAQITPKQYRDSQKH